MVSDELARGQARLTAELDVGDRPQPLVHPNLAKIYRKKVEQLGDALRGQEHGRKTFELVRSLIQEVSLVPRDGTLVLELKGDLAGILAMSDTAKPVRDAKARALQIKVVAGTGFGRCRLPSAEFLMSA